MFWEILIGTGFGILLAIIPTVISNKVAKLTDPDITKIKKEELKNQISNWLLANSWVVLLYGIIFSIWLSFGQDKVIKEQAKRISEIELKVGLNPFPVKPDTLDINKIIIEQYGTRAEDTK
jgi:hypothetical protein